MLYLQLSADGASTLRRPRCGEAARKAQLSAAPRLQGGAAEEGLGPWKIIGKAVGFWKITGKQLQILHNHWAVLVKSGEHGKNMEFSCSS